MKAALRFPLIMACAVCISIAAGSGMGEIIMILMGSK